ARVATDATVGKRKAVAHGNLLCKMVGFSLQEQCNQLSRHPLSGMFTCPRRAFSVAPSLDNWRNGMCSQSKISRARDTAGRRGNPLVADAVYCLRLSSSATQ